MLLFLALLASCSTSKTLTTAKETIKGEWTLQDITYSSVGTYNITLLQDASKMCFEGSTWKFVPNNNTGIYTIEDSNCSTGDRYFIFKIEEVDKEAGGYDFLLKPTDEKYKSTTNNSGFRFQLTHLDDTTMQWQQSLLVDGAPIVIYMNFSKLLK